MRSQQVERPLVGAGQRFPCFQGLRALAAAAIVLFHAGVYAGVNARPHGWGPWARQLDVGVSVFFVLSAFLLYRPFVRARLLGTPPPAVGRYLGRRVLRIVPAYWIALTVDAHVLHHTELGGWWSQVRYYGFLQIYWGDTVLGGLTQAWTLCTEMSFYLFLPVWAAAMARVRASTLAQRRRLEYLGCLALYLGALAFRWWLRADGHAIGYGTLLAQADLFALGMALAVAHTVRTAGPAPAEDRAAVAFGDRPWVPRVAAACCYGAVVGLGLPIGFAAPSAAQEVTRQFLYGAIAVLVVAPAVFGPARAGLGRRLLASPALVWAGTVSYGVYLWHQTLLGDLNRWLSEAGTIGRSPTGQVVFVGGHASNWPLLAGLGLAGSLVVASASWLLVERPILRWRPGRPTPGTGPAATSH